MSQNPGIGSNSGTTQQVSTKTPLTPLTPTSASVGVTSSTVVSSNSSRKGLTLVNLSTNVISLGFGSNAAVLNSGDTLTQYGSSYTSSEYDYFTGAVQAIASGASSTLSIQEYI